MQTKIIFVTASFLLHVGAYIMNGIYGVGLAMIFYGAVVGLTAGIKLLSDYD